MPSLFSFFQTQVSRLHRIVCGIWKKIAPQKSVIESPKSITKADGCCDWRQRDLLKRHFVAHDISGSTAGLSAQDAESARSLLAKARSTAACLHCAQNKTKCDNDVNQPCSRCRSKNLTCTARTTRPRGPRPRHTGRPSLEKSAIYDALGDGIDDETSGNAGGDESPAISGARKTEPYSAMGAHDGEPGSSITVASPLTAAATTTAAMNAPIKIIKPPLPLAPSDISPEKNTSPPCSYLQAYDMESNQFVCGPQNPITYTTLSQGDDRMKEPQLHTNAAATEIPSDPHSASPMQQSVSVDQSTEFMHDIFPPMGAAGDGPLLFGPSWDLGSSPDQFFNPASEVFGPFLGFNNANTFDVDMPTVPASYENSIIQVEAHRGPSDEQGIHGDSQHQQLEPHLSHDTGAMKRNTGIGGSDVKRHGKDTANDLISHADATLSSALGNNAEAHPIEPSLSDAWLTPMDIEHWTMFQCCPIPSSIAPGRARDNLAFLETISKQAPCTWGRYNIGDAKVSEESPSINVSISPVTRERMSAIVQSFFAKALSIHGLGVTSSSSSRRASEWFGSSGFILLPPTEELESFLENYMNYVEPYFPLVPTRTLDPNELLVASENEKGATLLLLLMIAIGASCDPGPAARRLGAGIVEMCRISLTDLVEKDNKYSTVPLILQCSLLLTIQSCWGGEKWQMDIGAGHRARYIAVSWQSGRQNNTCTW